MTTTKNPVAVRVWTRGENIINSTHLLIAGTTGAGKSVLINNLIYTILATKPPNAAALALIDTKRVELCDYIHTKHARQYAQTTAAAVNVLNTITQTIEQRYNTLQTHKLKQWHGEQIYLIIDELADLLISDERQQIIRLLQHILQIGRAAGVHVIAATQAPNRKILSAELVLNFTDRIALRCISSVESRQIIQISGAEKLPKHGEAIYLSPDGITKIEIPLIDGDEIQKLIDFWKN